MSLANVQEYAEDGLRAARQKLVKEAGLPVWRLRELRRLNQLSAHQDGILSRIDELDRFSKDAVTDALTELAFVVADEVAEIAFNVRHDLNAAGTPPTFAYTPDEISIVLHFDNGTALLIGEHDYVIAGGDRSFRGPVAQIEQLLPDLADVFGGSPAVEAPAPRGSTPQQKLARIRKLYDDECARTVSGCSDDLELFLADLREALDS